MFRIPYTNRHSFTPRLATAAVLVAACTTAVFAQPQYTIELLGPATLIRDINASGNAVGWSTSTGVQRGWAAGPSQPHVLLPLPPGYTNSQALNINDAGVIVGSAGASTAAEFGQAIAWIPDGRGGYATEFLGALPGHTRSVATAINNRGDIVGYSINPIPFTGFGPGVWFNAPEGVRNITALGATSNPTDINDFGVMIGFAAPMFDLDSSDTSAMPPHPVGGTAPLAVNNSGELAGYVVDTGQQTTYATRYTHELGWEQMGPTFGTGAFDINDEGTTVFEASFPTFGTSVAVHFNEFGTRRLVTLILPDQGNWVLFPNLGEKINNNGVIAVIAEDLSTFESGVAIMTPLPDGNPADLNGDSVVDGLDLGMLLANWSIPAGSPGCGGATPCAPDLNGDGVVDGLDLGILLSQWSL